jgi:HPt (histidine-containing phosphotransfer) domain-containing protein/HAMP domain-containing protein
MKTLWRPIGGSIGRKQAGATFALILVATAGGYHEVSKYQREGLLAAKEAAASAVTRLFADSCAAAVVFEDDGGIQATLGTLSRNEEVEYAAVWGIDKSGHANHKLGELARGRTVPMQDLSLGAPIQRESDRVNLLAPVRDAQNRTVALAITSFSLKRETRMIAQAQRATLLAAGVFGLSLMLLLMGLAKVIIGGPLGKLVAAAKELEKGGDGAVEIRTSDEVGELARAFASMAAAIKVREALIKIRNRDMRLVLDNVGQGFLTLDITGTMSDERSRVIHDWFGPVEGQPKFWEYLSGVNAPVADWFKVSWESVSDDVLPLDLCLDQLPARITKADRTFELAYRPIMEGDRLAKTIVVITEVTARLQREQAELAQREMLSIFRRMRSDRVALEGFFAEGTALVEYVVADARGATATGSDLSVVRRQIHTIKGNCALFGVESVVVCCHEIEQRMSDSDEGLSVDERDRLRTLWAAVLEKRAQLMSDGAAGDRIEIDRDEYVSFIKDLENRTERDQLLATARAWQHEPASQRLLLIEDQIQALAKRLGRSQVTVVREPTSLRLPPRRWEPFWSAFAHVVRNTVDHGIDTADGRIQAGKSPHATVTLSVVHEDRQVVVSIGDDGQGIDWDRIATIAKRRGLPHADRADLERALFVDKISSRADQVTLTSGRGLGLGAIGDVVSGLGGRIGIQTEAGRGTTFRFWLPDSILDQDGETGREFRLPTPADPAQPQSSV